MLFIKFLFLIITQFAETGETKISCNKQIGYGFFFYKDMPQPLPKQIILHIVYVMAIAGL